MSYLRDKRYLRIPFEEDKENYLSRLPRELFLKVMNKACAGEQEEYRRLASLQGDSKFAGLSQRGLDSFSYGSHC